MKKCCNSLPKQQKKLLKVLTCLYETYVLNQTPSTVAYLTNPTEDGYDLMKIELDAITTLINNYLTVNKIFINGLGETYGFVNIWTSTAMALVAYNNNSNDENTFLNAITNVINVNQVINNVGTTKPVQKLNIDDCLEKSYQVTPVTEYNREFGTDVTFTQASLVERIGCSGVSNLGFLGVQLNVPIEEAPFNNCYVPKCSDKCE